MAYYFMVEKKKGQYEALNIDSIFTINNKKKYTKEGAYGLEELDMFTMQFYDELELRKSLLSDQVLDVEYILKPLSIRWCSKGQYNKVPYEFLYQKDLEFVVDPSKLIALILRRYYNGEFLFIKKFGEFFSGYHDCATTASEVRMYADMAVKYETGNKYLEERDKNGNNMVQRLIKLLLFEYYENPDGYIDYKNKIKYRNLHMMIAFINNYDIKYGLVEQKEKIELKDLIPEPKVKTRKKTKRNEEVDGQISLFDIYPDA